MPKNYLTVLLMALFMISGNFKTSFEGQGNLSCQLPQEFICRFDTPGFDVGIFEARRRRMMDKMKGEIAIISASTGNDFIYLTGFTSERQAVAVLDPASDKPFTLFVLPREPMTALWDGERPGIEGAVERYGADAAYPVERFDEKLPCMVDGKKFVSLHGDDKALGERIKKIAGKDKGVTAEETAGKINEEKTLKNAGECTAKTDGDASISLLADLAPILHEMRVVKDDWELAQLEKAIRVTSLAQSRVLQTVRPGQKEYDVQAEIEYVFRKNGLSTGFPSIVGSGPNAAVLHYRDNDRLLENGDLLLMDVGASCRGYVADVTRTIPVSGKFSKNQRELYSLVLKANQEAIKKMLPGKGILDCHHKATEIITRGLYELGLITDTTSWWQKRFYIHYRNNHYIGLDVHDTGTYGYFNAADRDSYILDPNIRGRELLPGMVMTIEPGIYLLADRLEHLHALFGDRTNAEELDAFAEKVRPVYKKYAGIGIRIEDDILITEDGNRVLSENAPKTMEEIEAAMIR